MTNCKKCGKNEWQWQCQNGLMTGFCPCGNKTNTFKATKGRKEDNGKREQELENKKIEKT